MPKFMTYQRPASISKQNWNHAPDRRAKAPRNTPEQPKPQPAIGLPALAQLIRKD